MKSKLLIVPFVLALAGAGCGSQAPAPVATNAAPAAQPSAPSSNIQKDSGIAIRQYTDPSLGFRMSYPAEWKLDESSGDIMLTNLGPVVDGVASDFITVKRVQGSSVTDSDAKFGDTTVRFDAKTNQWMVKAPDENGDYTEGVASPVFSTNTGLPVFRSTGRWATDIVALAHDKYLVVNISGDGWTEALDPFVKTITLSDVAQKPEDVNASMQAILDAEQAATDSMNR